MTRQLTREGILFDMERLPASPQLIPRLQRLVFDVNLNPDDVLDSIKLDPGLAAKILQACNCAAIAPACRVDTISDAVTRLGFDDVYHLVSLSVLKDGFPRSLPAYRTTAAAIWHQSLTAAFLMDIGTCRQLGRIDAGTVGCFYVEPDGTLDDEALKEIIIDHFRGRPAGQSGAGLFGLTSSTGNPLANLLRHLDSSARAEP